MNDFIEKPSRMILFIVGIITLITVIILLSRSGFIRTGGESLVDSKGRTLVTKAPENPDTVTADGGEDTGYEEVYVEDDYDDYEEDEWDGEPADTGEVIIEVPEEQAEEGPVTEEMPAEQEETGEDTGYEEETAGEDAEIWDEVTEEEG
ncbi:MAG TPA: hypothetical protein DCG37_08900 [Lachnospiraceae bacterium]|nr:hypothetical protein [Lachnospiraceae bacterium]